MLLAWYDDTYVCEDGSWLFASRRLTPIYRGHADFRHLDPPG